MMESLERSKAVLALGKQMVTELGLGDDLMTRWMAHYLAERIDAVEQATPEHRAAAQDACAQAVFKFWEHRHVLPEHIRPFRELEPMLQTLASLDADSGSRFRYMRPPPGNDEVDDDKVSGKQLLAFAMTLDHAARVLIQYVLGAAAAEAGEKAEPWLKAAADADVDAVLEFRVVEFASRGVGVVPDASEVARKALEDKAKKLEMFADLARDVAAEFRSRSTSPKGDEANADQTA